MRTTSEVMETYLEAVSVRDLDAIADTFCSDGFVIWGGDVWRGRNGVRDFYRMIQGETLPRGLEHEDVHSVIETDICHLVWRAKSALREISVGVDTFVVRDGGIHCLTVHMEGDF